MDLAGCPERQGGIGNQFSESQCTCDTLRSDLSCSTRRVISWGHLRILRCCTDRPIRSILASARFCTLVNYTPSISSLGSYVLLQMYLPKPPTGIVKETQLEKLLSNNFWGGGGGDQWLRIYFRRSEDGMSRNLGFLFLVIVSIVRVQRIVNVNYPQEINLQPPDVANERNG